MEKDLLSRFLGRDVGRIDAYGGMLGRFVWIGDPGELLDDTGARLGVESFAVSLLTDFEGCGDVDERSFSWLFDRVRRRPQIKRAPRRMPSSYEAPALRTPPP